MVEASRIMNLYQFIQLYKDITSQAAEVLAAVTFLRFIRPFIFSTYLGQGHGEFFCEH